MVSPFSAVADAGLLDRAGVIEWHPDGTLARVVLAVPQARRADERTPEQADADEDLVTYGAA